MNAPTIACLGAIVLAAAAGMAQSPAPARLAQRDTRVHTAFGLQERGNTLHALGTDYHAVFDRHGVELTPALGKRAARDLPLGLRLCSVERGATVLCRGMAATPRREGDVVVYDRQGDITERWHVKHDGLELALRFAAPTRGAGDLVVSFALDTDLVGEATAEGGARLLQGDVGGVRIGAVFGVDAAGWRVPGSLRIGKGRLELVLPAGFVDRAAYPMELDPLFGSEFGVASGTADTSPDCVYDEAADTWVTVWQRSFSTTHSEVWMQRVDAQGALVGPLTRLAGGPGSFAGNPAVARIALSDRFLVVWQEAPSALGPFQIEGLALNPDGSMSSQVTIGAATSGSQVDPDVGGDPTTVSDSALVVWSEQGKGLRVARVTVSLGVGPPAPSTPIALTTGFQDERPAITKSPGGVGRYVIVWQRVGVVALIRAAIVRRDLRVLQGLFGVSVGYDSREPDVDGDGNNFVVVYQRREKTGSSPGPSDIYLRLMRWDPTTLSLFNAIPETPVANDPGADETEPAVGLQVRKYLIAWSDGKPGSPLDSDLAAREVDTSICLPCGPEYIVAGPKSFDHAPAIGTQYTAGPADDDLALVVFASADRTLPFQSTVRAQVFDAVGTGGTIANLGGACGPGGTAAVSGAFAIGNPSFAFTLSGADPAATQAVFVANSGVTPVACESCLLIVPAIAASFPMTGGAGQIPLAIPCNTTWLGATLDVQWWVLPVAASPCSLAPGVAVSNILQATVGL